MMRNACTTNSTRKYALASIGRNPLEPPAVVNGGQQQLQPTALPLRTCDRAYNVADCTSAALLAVRNTCKGSQTSAARSSLNTPNGAVISDFGDVGCCAPKKPVKSNMHNPIPIKHTNVIPTNIDHIPPNTTHSGSSAMLYVFEDNEAVIKMITKGRRPTLRHVSRTHRDALDWLFDRINLDPKIQSRYIDTKHQLTDMLTKGNFTRDEWNNLFHLLNISHFSSTCCTKNFSLISCSTIWRRGFKIQKKKKELCPSRDQQ